MPQLVLTLHKTKPVTRCHSRLVRGAYNNSISSDRGLGSVLYNFSQHTDRLRIDGQGRFGSPNILTAAGIVQLIYGSSRKVGSNDNRSIA